MEARAAGMMEGGMLRRIFGSRGLGVLFTVALPIVPSSVLAALQAGEAVQSVGGVLRRADAALGTDALLAMDAFTWRETALQSWTGQGLSPEQPTRIRTIERRISIDLPGNRLSRSSRMWDGATLLDWCENTWITEGRLRTEDCLTGENTIREGVPVGAWRRALAGLPHLEIRRMLDGGATLTPIDSPAGEECFALADGSTTWCFDRETGLPVSATRGDVDALGRPSTSADRWSEYRRIDGAVIPTAIQRLRPDRTGSEAVALSDVSTALDETDFAQTTRTGPVRIPRGPTEVIPVSDDAWVLCDVVPGSNALLVRGDDGFTLVEAPGGRKGAEEIRRLTVELGGAVVRIVLTHFHTDHLSALSHLKSDRPVEVLVPPGAIDLVTDLLVDRGDFSVRAVQDREPVAPGRRDTSLRLTSGLPHVDELVVPVLAGGDVLYVADLFQRGRAGALPYAHPLTRRLVEFTRGLPRVPMAIWGSHLDAFTVIDLALSVDRGHPGG